MDSNVYKRLARAEAMAAAQRAEQPDAIQAAYQRACDNGDEESAAFYARKMRNRLLEQSDAEMVFDRMGLVPPEGAEFADWLAFLRALGGVTSSAMAAYRQELRDLPQQPGFPFEITVPTKPEDGSNSDV